LFALNVYRIQNKFPQHELANTHVVHTCNLTLAPYTRLPNITVGSVSYTHLTLPTSDLV